MTGNILKFSLFMVIASGAFWTLSVASLGDSGGLEVLALFLMVFALQAIGFVIGLWMYWRHPDERRNARWLLALPFVFYFLPGVVKTLAGGQLSSGGLAALLLFIVAAILVASLIVPRKVAGRLPEFLFQSRFINTLILMLPMLGWLFIIGILVWLFVIEAEATSRSLSNDATGYGLAATIVIGSIYLVGLGAGSLLVGAWGWLGIRSGIDGACRKLNIAQLLVAAPGLLIGVFALYLMLMQT